jgi:methylglutaconyl-CoA hydratase
MVQGSAYGGGAGLIAACDIGIAASNATFCFSEVKLGLIPAVISPYVVQALGARITKSLFISAEQLDAQRALQLNLIHHCVGEDKLFDFTVNYATMISTNAPGAVKACKKLVEFVSNKTIDEKLAYDTAALIAERRTSAEGQKGLQAFLNKQTPNWN